MTVKKRGEDAGEGSREETQEQRVRHFRSAWKNTEKHVFVLKTTRAGGKKIKEQLSERKQLLRFRGRSVRS